MSPYEKLQSLGLTLPPGTASAGAFAPAVRTGDLLFVSGHIAKRDGQVWLGQLGAGLATAEGREAARGVALDLLGTLHEALGDLERIRRIVKILVLVNSAPTFTEQHLVANGASELLEEVLGGRGRHARSAFGTAQLPLGTCVEIELIAEVAEVAEVEAEDAE
jgi:enamine deaminase RidA (YjgF/YER057c/UK114 family)